MSGEVFDVRRALELRKPGHSLPAAFYNDPAVFALDVAHLFRREWLFVGHHCEIPDPGDYITLDVVGAPILVVRGEEGRIRAFHNTCRHRGSKLCDARRGSVKRRVVCPYHQWSYELDGRLARTRGMGEGFDPGQHGLKGVHLEGAGGYLFVCLAEAAPDFAPIRAMLQPYVAAFDLADAKVAFESTIVERGNWKLVIENNRECYHCAGSHPELCRTFPETPTLAGTGEAGNESLEGFWASCESMGLPSRYRIAEDAQFRAVRLPLLDGARSMTLTGEPAVQRPLGRLPAADIGDVLFYHYPSTWNHATADHAISFRVLPLGPDATELTTKWLVARDAVEGLDYDLTALTEVWLATNAQDAALVERNQAGIRSPAYEPGPYSPVHEAAVIRFVDWYAGTLAQRLPGTGAGVREAA